MTGRDSGSASVQGENHPESRPLAQLRFDTEPAAMAGDDMLHDGETTPRAAFGPALAGIDPVKSFGQPRQMFRRDPRAMVADAQNTLARLGRKGNLDLPVDAPRVRATIFNGVFDEVFGQPQEFVAVARDERLGRDVEVQDY